MTLPRQSTLVANLSADFALWDVFQALPWRGRWPSRDESKISHLYVHKSGADGPAGFRGVVGMARFCRDDRGWHGAPYHVWLSAEPDADCNSRFVIYRCLPWSARSYHTGLEANVLGIGIAIQGNYDSDWDGLAAIEPTALQQRGLALITDYLAEAFDLDLAGTGPLGRVLSGHWEAPKPKRVCPGDWGRDWVLNRRDDTPVARPAISGPVWPFGGRCPSVFELQETLALLGYDPGPIDGVRGYRTRAALEAFQSAAGLEADGWYGPKTARALTQALLQR